jgi:sugar lactone lactonase YvrE
MVAARSHKMRTTTAIRYIIGLAGLLMGSEGAPADILYVSSPSRIEKFDANGTDLGTFANVHATGLAFDSGGNLYAAIGNTIEKFGPDGTDLGTFANTGLSVPGGLAFDQTGNLYVANLADSTIMKFAPNGTASLFAQPDSLSAPNWNLANPVGLAFDSSGNLFVANSGNGAITRFDSTGAYTLACYLGANSYPNGLAVDHQGNFYVANNWPGSCPNGIYRNGLSLSLVTWNSYISCTSGLAFDSSDNLYAVRFNGPFGPTELDKIAPDGTISVLATSGSFDAYSFIAVQPVPEPSIFALAGIGAVGLAIFSRRRPRCARS